MWTYCCYDDGRGEELWSTWYRSVDKRTKAKHDEVWDILECRRASEWVLPYAKLIGNGIFQIHIKTDVQWRIWGYFGEGETLVILLIGSHKQNVYTPRDAIEVAKRRKREIDRGLKGTRKIARPRFTR